jgi:hypothetical protein
MQSPPSGTQATETAGRATETPSSILPVASPRINRSLIRSFTCRAERNACSSPRVALFAARERRVMCSFAASAAQRDRYLFAPPRRPFAARERRVMCSFAASAAPPDGCLFAPARRPFAARERRVMCSFAASAAPPDGCLFAPQRHPFATRERRVMRSFAASAAPPNGCLFAPARRPFAAREHMSAGLVSCHRGRSAAPAVG